VGLVLNRVHVPKADITGERALAAAEVLANGGPKRPARDAPAGGSLSEEELQARHLAASLLRLHAERVALARRESRLTGRFLASNPGIRVLELPAQAEDIHDLEGLRDIIEQSL